MNFDVKKCEKIIGYVFNDKSLIINAFTHSSYTNEHKNYPSNERMEFLGDSILGYVVAEKLYYDFPDKDEGFLTLKKQSLVSKTPLSKAIVKTGLDKYLILGEGEQKSAKKQNLCENLFESVVAAIYLDGGIDFARKFILSTLDFNNENFDFDCVDDDYKSKLLHMVQQRRLGEIEYFEVSKSGPAHAPEFVMGVKIEGKILATATASSHKKGEKLAAKAAIDILQSEDFRL